MRHAPMLSAIALGALSPAACGEPPAGPTGPTAEETERQQELLGRGEVIAETLCADCHAVGRSGDSPHMEAVPFRQLSWKYPVRSLEQPLSEGIVVGHPDMPEWQFEPQDVDALLAYIESIQQPQET